MKVDSLGRNIMDRDDRVCLLFGYFHRVHDITRNVPWNEILKGFQILIGSIDYFVRWELANGCNIHTHRKSMQMRGSTETW